MDNALNLYAKIEDLLNVDEVTPILYQYYYNSLKDIEFNSLLDVGCGRGEFLLRVHNRYPDKRVMGIDLSSEMVKRTQSLGMDAKCIDLCELDEKFDVITAIFDMVNYLDSNSLKRFMRCIEERLNTQGYFICDINSFYAFRDLATGHYLRDDDSRFVTIDSFFKNNEFISQFTLFVKGKDNRFTKFQEDIIQYYHRVKDIENATSMRLIQNLGIGVYGDEVEKHYLIFQKVDER